MKKAVIFGAGEMGKRIYEMCRDSYDILCFVDNYKPKYVTGGGGSSFSNKKS